MDLNGYNVDSSSSPAIEANVNGLVGQSNADVAHQYGQHTSEARGLLNQGENFNSRLGGYGDKATTDAIRSRYSMPYNREEKRLKLDIMQNAATDHIRNLQVASQAAGQEVEDNRQKAILRWKVEQANKKARGAVLGNVLGIVGGVVAGIYSGGTGAAAGYAAGQGAGNAIGGS